MGLGVVGSLDRIGGSLGLWMGLVFWGVFGWDWESVGLWVGLVVFGSLDGFGGLLVVVWDWESVVDFEGIGGLWWVLSGLGRSIGSLGI